MDLCKTFASGRLILLSLLLAAGLVACASPPTKITMNVQVPPIGARPLPLSGALVIPESISSVTQEVAITCGDTTNYIIPTGKQLERGARQALSQVLSDVTVVKDKALALGEYQLVIEPTVPVVNIAAECKSREWLMYLPIVGFFFAKEAMSSGVGQLRTEVALRVKISDQRGQSLLDQEYNSGAHFEQYLKQDFGMNAKAVGTTTEQSLTTVLQEMARGLVDSKPILLYAQNVPTNANPRPLRPGSSLTRSSDVDDPPASKMKAHSNRYAVVIGIEQYREQLPKAEFARRDALIMSQYLTKTMGYPEQNVVILLDDRASLTDISKYIESWLPNKVDSGSSVFVYYSGHGAPSVKTGDGYLVPYDGDPTFIESTGYSIKRLYTNLEQLQAKEIVVVLDSCFSGSGGRSVIAKGARPMVISVQNPILASGKTVVLTASTGDQISNAHYKEAHGLLTYFFLKGLRGEADANKDGGIELRELFDYVSPQVQSLARRESNSEQTPQLLGSHDLLKQGVLLVGGNK